MTSPEMQVHEDAVQRLWEDSQAKAHGGYFKLWRMAKVEHDRRYYHGEQEWQQTELIGIYPSREPCEAFLDLIEHGPEATYEFCAFNHGLDHIKGAWAVELDQNGEIAYSQAECKGSIRWRWDYTPDAKSYCHSEDRNTGYGRTKAEAIANAKAYMVELAEFIRVERPKRAKNCFCQPNNNQPCGYCKDAAVDAKKKDCGCPNCKGDH